MTPHDFKDLLDRYSRGECTKEEEKFILTWYEKIGNDKQEDLPEEHSIIMGAKLWSKLRPSDASRHSTFKYTLKIAAAIAIIALAGGGIFFLSEQFSGNSKLEIADKQDSVLIDKMIRIINKEGTPRNIRLDDGSEIVLKAQSEIRFLKTFSAGKREVYLTGEAFFKVTRDTLRPFLVYTNEVVTKVLGTSFTVKAYQWEKEISVAVRSGKVSVYTLPHTKGNTGGRKHAKEVILIPNQQAIYNRDDDHVSKQLVEKPEIILPAPTLFAMKYDGAPVVKIFEVLEENYGIDIAFDEAVLSGCALTTSMADEGLYERIKIICEAIGAQYEVQDTSIVIKGAGCH